MDLKEGESDVNFARDIKLGVQIKPASKLSFKIQAAFQSISAGFGSDLVADRANRYFNINNQ